MAIHVNGKLNIPNIVCLSTDVTAGKIAGANPGMTVFFSDTSVSKIVLDDLTLVDYVAPSSSGAPPQYSQISQHSDSFFLLKGGLSKLRLRPAVQNEHCESSRELLGTLTATVELGQFFKASSDNINEISLTAESAALFTSMDDITFGAGENKAGTQEYSGSAALQAEWIKSGAVEATRVAFTDLGGTTQDGNYCMQMPMDVLATEWRATLTSTDLTGMTFSIKYANTDTFDRAKMYFFVGDGTNTKSFPMSVGTNDIWQTFKFSETSMAVESTDDTATTPNMAAITKMGFRVDDKQALQVAYADSISYQAEAGSFDIELWGFGSTIPVGDGTEDYTAVGTQYTEIGDRGIGGAVMSSINVPLLGGKRKYQIHDFIAGVALEHPDNTLLVPDEYYALVLKYNDTELALYGADTTYSTDYYVNGYAWKADAADDFIDKIAGAAGAGAYSDFMFQIFSTEDVYITGATLFADSAPSSNTSVSVYVEDSSMGITDIPVVSQDGGFGDTSLPLDLSDSPPLMQKGGKFEAYFNDDGTDSALTKILFVMRYRNIPPTVNG